VALDIAFVWYWHNFSWRLKYSFKSVLRFWRFLKKLEDNFHYYLDFGLICHLERS